MMNTKTTYTYLHRTHTTITRSHLDLHPRLLYKCYPLSNIILPQYTVARYKPIAIYFNMSHPQSIPFGDKVSSKISLGNIYTFFIKVRYDYNNFFIAGSQFGFYYYSNDKIDNLLQIVNNRLEDCFNTYNITDELILYVQLSFKLLDNKLLSEFLLTHNPKYITKQENLPTTKKLNIPVYINKDSLANELSVEVDNGLITKNYLNLQNHSI